MASENQTNDQRQASSGHHRSKAYDDARSGFDRLRMEEKAAFLLESILNTVADGLKDVSAQVSDAIRHGCSGTNIPGSDMASEEEVHVGEEHEGEAGDEHGEHV
jgi:hypothetical protein